MGGTNYNEAVTRQNQERRERREERGARRSRHHVAKLFFETASPEEVRTRLYEEVYLTRVEIAVG